MTDDGVVGLWRGLVERVRWLLHGGELAEPDVPAGDPPLERPWRHRWDHLPKRTAGWGFTRHDYREARRRAEEVARLTLGDAAWNRLRRDGYLDLPSGRYPGVTYRLRIGQRLEVRRAPGVR